VPSIAVHIEEKKEERGEEKGEKRREEVGETGVSPIDHGSLLFLFLI